MSISYHDAESGPYIQELIDHPLLSHNQETDAAMMEMPE